MGFGLSKWARLLFVVVFASAFFTLYEKASASTITCAAAAAIADTNDPAYTGGYNVTNYVAPTDACALGSDNNDKLELAGPEPLQVNVDNVFGYSNWQFAEKLQAPDGSTLLTDNSVQTIDIGLSTTTGSPTGGIWNINDVWSLYDEIMLVFKGGNGNPINPNVYVAYLLTEGSTSGSYTSPFHNGSNFANISHISAYVIPSVVPLPAAFPLFGAALAGMGLLGWWRRRAAA